MAVRSRVRLSRARLEPSASILGSRLKQSADALAIEVSTGELSQRFERGLCTLARRGAAGGVSKRWTVGMCFRGGKEMIDLGRQGRRF